MYLWWYDECIERQHRDALLLYLSVCHASVLGAWSLLKFLCLSLWSPWLLSGSFPHFNRCICMLAFCEKPLRHLSQLNGFSPEWQKKWRFSFEGVWNTLLHSEQGYWTPSISSDIDRSRASCSFLDLGIGLAVFFFGLIVCMKMYFALNNVTEKFRLGPNL